MLLSQDQIKYLKSHKDQITFDLLQALRKHGNEGKQLALDILDTPMDAEMYHLDAFGNRISMDGDRKLKKPYTKMNLAPIHIEEIQRCKEDIHYFKDNYVKIKTQKGINFPDIRPYQNEFLDVLNGNYESIISLMSRQAGKSITVAIELSWHYLFNENINIGICANKSKLAREFLNNVKNIFLELPMWMQPGTITWNKGSIVNENAMRILTDAPSSDSFRGFTIGLLVVDELAFIKNDKWKAMKDSVIPSQSGLSWKKNIFISTANGLNHFFDLVNGAKKRKRLYNVSKDQKVRMKDGSIITLDEYYKIVQDRQQTVTEQA